MTEEEPQILRRKPPIESAAIAGIPHGFGFSAWVLIVSIAILAIRRVDAP